MGWKFDWLMANDTNIVKVLEGNYKNSKVKSSNPFKDILFLQEVENEQKRNLISDNQRTKTAIPSPTSDIEGCVNFFMGTEMMT